EITEKFRVGLRAVAADQSRTVVLIGLLGWLARASRARQIALLAVLVLVIILPTAAVLTELRLARGELRENQQSIASLETKLTDTQRALAEREAQLNRTPQ